MAIFFYFRNSISRCHEVNDLTAARMPSCTPIPVRRGISGCAWRVTLGTPKSVGEASGKSPAPTAKPLHPDPGRGPETQRGRSVGAGGRPCRIGEAPGGPPKARPCHAHTRRCRHPPGPGLATRRTRFIVESSGRSALPPACAGAGSALPGPPARRGVPRRAQNRAPAARSSRRLPPGGPSRLTCGFYTQTLHLAGERVYNAFTDSSASE